MVFVDMIGDMLENIYGCSMYYGIQEIIVGIYPIMDLKDGGQYVGWPGQGVLMQLTCLVARLFQVKLYTFMRCLTGFAIYMWPLVVSRSSDYWLGTSPRVTIRALVEVKVCLGIPSCGTRWVPRGSRGLILGSTGRGRPILGSTGRGRPLLYPASVFPTHPLRSLGLGARVRYNGESFLCKQIGRTFW